MLGTHRWGSLFYSRFLRTINLPVAYGTLMCCYGIFSTEILIKHCLANVQTIIIKINTIL